MPSSDYEDWREYESLEPFGAIRDNMHAGIIAATLQNLYLKKGHPPLTHSNFILHDAETHRAIQTERTLKMFSSLSNKGKKDATKGQPPPKAKRKRKAT